MATGREHVSSVVQNWWGGFAETAVDGSASRPYRRWTTMFRRPTVDGDRTRPYPFRDEGPSGTG
jgi:hypothetical protein